MRQLRHPFRQPFLVGGRDLGCDRRRVAIRRDGLADLFQQRVEDQPGVTDQADLGLDILVEMVGVERRMDDGLALRHGDAERRLGEASSRCRRSRRRRPGNFGTARGTARPPDPSDSGCVSGKDDLPPRLVVTGMARRSASRLQLRPGLGVMHALAGIDHRPLRRDEQSRRFLAHARDPRRSGCAAPACSSAVPALPRSTCRPGFRRSPARRGRSSAW